MNEARSQQASPVRGVRRGRGRGRGGGLGSRGGIKRIMAGRRGRQKLFETNKAQAAHEQQRELKTAFNVVANAIKPALEELADRNVDLVGNQMDAHREVGEYKEIRQFLNGRLRAEVAAAGTRLRFDEPMRQSVYDVSCEYTLESFRVRWNELTEEFYDAQLKRLDILEELFDNREPVDKIDNGYDYRPITKERLANNGQYLVFRDDGIYVPFPKFEAEEAKKAKDARTPSKRKPGDQGEGQPAFKKTASALTGGSALSAPRHTAGLFSESAPEDPASPGSKVPSPSPGDGDGEYAEAEAADMMDIETSAQEILPPLPNGASEPDAYGARLVNKRARAGEAPNNRIMIPQSFQWEDHEIGFRDSTNSKSKGATKAKRGTFVNLPNSGTFHYDRMVYTCDSTQNEEGHLDPELVRKHKLHPKYGIFLPTSVNDWEPPRPFNNGQKPAVFLGPEGEILHTSRSVAASRAEEPLRKKALAECLKHFIEREGIDMSEIEDEEVRQRVKAQADAKKKHRLELEAEEQKAREEQDEETARVNLQALVEASAFVEEQPEEKPKAPSPQPAKHRRSTVSRPYDAIRDVFTNTESTESSSPEPDITSLSLLADLALDPPELRQPAYVHNLHPAELQASTQFQEHLSAPQPPMQEQQPLSINYPPILEQARGDRRLESEMPLDPQLFGAPSHSSAGRRLSIPDHLPPSTERENMLDPRLYDQPSHQVHASMQGPPSFFQTALNAPSTYSPIPSQPYMSAPPPAGHYPPLAPAPPRDHLPSAASSRGHMTPDAGLGRNPFGSPDNGDGLPPLRPHGRGSLVPTTGQVPPPLAHSGMLATGSSSYLPPPPPPPHEMAYRNGYPMPDQGHMGMDPVLTQSPYPQSMLAVYPMSPPFPGQPPPGHMLSPPPQSASMYGTPLPPRRVSSVSSNPNSRFRKLEPAPTPPHRRGWNKNSTELRTVTYEPKESIKDYTATAPTPSHGPTQIRGWNHTASRRAREAAAAAAAAAAKSEGSPERDEQQK